MAAGSLTDLNYRRLEAQRVTSTLAVLRGIGHERSRHSRGGVISLDHFPTQLQVGRCIDGATPLATATPHSCFRRDFRCPSVPFATIEDDPDIAPVPKVLAQFFVSVEAAARDDDKEHRRPSAAGSPKEASPVHPLDGEHESA